MYLLKGPTRMFPLLSERSPNARPVATQPRRLPETSCQVNTLHRCSLISGSSVVGEVEAGATPKETGESLLLGPQPAGCSGALL